MPQQKHLMQKGELPSRPKNVLSFTDRGTSCVLHKSSDSRTHHGRATASFCKYYYHVKHKTYDSDDPPLVTLHGLLPHVGRHSVILNHLLVAGVHAGADAAGEQLLLPDRVQVVQEGPHMATGS